MKLHSFILIAACALTACSGGGGSTEEAAKAGAPQIVEHSSLPSEHAPASAPASPQNAQQSQAAVHRDNGLPDVIEQF